MIEQAMSLKKRYDTMVKNFDKEHFREYFTDFFNLYPFITKIEWTQYTPSFNDGDPCYFSATYPKITLTPSYVFGAP